KTLSIKLILLFVMLCAAVTGCDDKFEEINTNPNQPEKISNPGLLLPAIIRGSMNDSYTGAWRRRNIVADYLANQFVSAFDWSPAYCCPPDCVYQLIIVIMANCDLRTSWPTILLICS